LFKKKGKKKISEIKNIEIFDPNFWGKGGSGVRKTLTSGSFDPEKLSGDGFVKKTNR